MDLNLFDVFQPIAVTLIDAKCPNSASGGLFEMVPESFLPDLDDFLLSVMTRCFSLILHIFFLHSDLTLAFFFQETLVPFQY